MARSPGPVGTATSPPESGSLELTAPEPGTADPHYTAPGKPTHNAFVDICPQGRAGNETNQAMLISGDNAQSRIMSCVDAAAQFQMSRDEALSLARSQN